MWFPILFLRKRRLLKIINIIAVDGAMGMYAEEIEAKITLPNIQPSKLRPDRKSIGNISVSFLLMIWKNVDFAVFIFYLLICFLINSYNSVLLMGLEI